MTPSIDPVHWTEISVEELEDAPHLRWYNCPIYEDCLDKAANEDWNGWTCLFCPFQDKHRKEKIDGS